jgi:hypothetical protein
LPPDRTDTDTGSTQSTTTTPTDTGPQRTPPVFEPIPSALWTFDNEDIIGSDVLDVWGGHDAILIGKDLISGQVGEALQFSNDTIVEVFNSAQLDFETQGTISVLMEFPSSGQPLGQIHIAGFETSPFAEFSIQVYAYDCGISCLSAHYQFFWGGRVLESLSDPYAANGMQHIVGVVSDTGDMRLYVDGNLENYTTAENRTSSGNKIRMGGFGADVKFMGQLDDVAIWDDALDSVQVLELYELNKAGISISPP